MGETDRRFLVLRQAFPFLFVKTKMVRDHQLSINRGVNQGGEIFPNVYDLEPLGPNKRP